MEVDSIYNKIFDKKFAYLINPKVAKTERKKENKQNERMKVRQNEYIMEKIKDIKSRIFFMKGIVDYSFPKVIVHKGKVFNEYLSQQKKEKSKDKRAVEHLKNSLESSKKENNKRLNNFLK